MVDIHSHIIPFADDGAASIEEAVEMALEAKRNGVKKIICTPHYISGRYENENIEEKFLGLKTALFEKGVDIELYLGNEVMFSSDSLEAIKNGKVKSMAGSRYLLVELYMVSKDILEKGMDLLIDMGYIPILAHIERYGDFDLHFFKSLAEKGVLFQCNLSSLKNPSFVKKVEKYLNSGIIDFFASDAHSSEYRTYDIKDCIERLEKLSGAKRAKLLLSENAEKLIQNDEIKKEKQYVEKNIGGIGSFSTVFSRLFGRTGAGRGTGKN